MARILVIDDDFDLSEVIKMMLERNGHEVNVANSGQDGLDLIRENRFDLVVLDVMMPDMDGYQVARQLRDNPETKDQMILILTARAQAIDKKAAFDAGADNFLAKPVPPKELNAKVLEMLEAGRASEGEMEGEPKPEPEPEPESQPTPEPEPARSGPKGRLFTILSMRGGTGQTTFAVNLALTLVRQKRRVCLVDLSPYSGHVALHFGLRKAPSWADLPNEFSQQQLGKVLVKHPSGLFLLAAPVQPSMSGMSSELFTNVLLALQSAFTDVIIDGASWTDAATRSAVEQANRLFIVLAPEIGSVQTTVHTLAMLKTTDFDLNKLRFILNQPNARPTVSRAAIEKALGRPISLELPFESLQQKAFMKGAPIALSAPNQPYSVGINKIMDLP